MDADRTEGHQRYECSSSDAFFIFTLLKSSIISNSILVGYLARASDCAITATRGKDVERKKWNKWRISKCHMYESGYSMMKAII